MKHCIIAKFKENISKEQISSFIPDIKNIFDKTLEIEGIKNIQIFSNCINCSNRYDLMIVITMEKSSLELYDNSEYHKQWKEKYGEKLEKKAIFDYEE